MDLTDAFFQNASDKDFRILTVLQYDEVMPSKIRQVLEAGDDAWYWMIRLHPLTRHLSEQYEHALRAQGMRNIEVQRTTKLSLRKILEVCDVVLTDYSTVSVEAAAAGIPSILMHSESADLLGTYLDTYKDTLFFRPQPQEAVKLLKELRETAPSSPSSPVECGSANDILKQIESETGSRSLFYAGRSKSFAQKALFDPTHYRRLAMKSGAVHSTQAKSAKDKGRFSLLVDANLFSDFADIALHTYFAAALSSVPAGAPLELILTRSEEIDLDALATCVKLLPFRVTIRFQKDYASIRNQAHVKEAFVKQADHNNWRDYLLCKSVDLKLSAFDQTQAKGNKRPAASKGTIVFYAGGQGSTFSVNQETFQLLTESAEYLVQQGHSVLITLAEVSAELLPMIAHVEQKDGIEIYTGVSFATRLALFQQSSLTVFPNCPEGLLGYCCAGFASLLVGRIDEDGSRLNDHQLIEKLGIIGVNDRPQNPASSIYWNEVSAQKLSDEILKSLSTGS